MIDDKIRLAIMDSSIGESLAKYNDEPAVFFQMAPNDGVSGWNDGLMFPRVDYTIDWSYEAERKTSGSLMVNIYCTNENEAIPEDMTTALVADVSEMFYTDDAETYCAVWNSSNSFDSGGDNEPIIFGVTIMFDLLAFPKQTTGVEPDPVKGFADYIDKIVPDAYKLGCGEELPQVFKATDEKPAIYIRLVSNKADMKRTYAVAWLNCALSVHVIAPSPNTREMILQRLLYKIALDAECILSDGSPMLFDMGTPSVDFSINPLFNGQLSLTGRYGLTPEEDDSPWLNHINMEFETSSGW